MVSCQVMKNNVKRMMSRKSTYLLMIVIPFLLILTGCFLSSTIVTGIQLFIILCGWRLLDADFTFTMLEIGKIFLFILVISNLYGIIVTSISKSEMMAGMLGSSFAVLFSLLGGTFIAFEKMPVLLRIFSHLSPVSWLLNWLV